MPPPSPRLLLRLLLGLVALGVIAAGATFWQRHSRVLAWASVRPPLPPPLGHAAPGLDARLAACAGQLNSWPPNPAALAEFARICHANGHLDSAAAAYRALISLQPAEPRWPHFLALILAGYGQLDEALPLLRQTVQLAPDYLTAWLKLGDTLLKSNALPEAEAAYREVLRRDAGNRYALLGLARCDLQADRLTSARAHLQRAVADHPEFASAQSLLGTVHERLGNTDAAALARSRVQQNGLYAEHPDVWADELAFESHDPYALLTAASAAVAENRIDRAHRLLARGLSLAPDNARLHRQLGKLLAVENAPAGARRAFERAIALEPANDALRLDLLAHLRRAGDEAAFAQAVADGLRHTPDSAGLHFEAGQLAAQAGRIDEAVTHFETSWRHGPDQPAAGLELATALAQAGHRSRATAILEDVSARFPREHAPLLRLIRHGIDTADPRTATWLERARTAGMPAPVLAELRDHHRRRFGASTP